MQKPPDNIHVRSATKGDFDALCALYHELNSEDLPATDALQRQTFADMLQQPGLTILVAERDCTPVATCTLVVVPNLTRGCAPYALIENVVTRAKHRGLGIGHCLMQAAIKKAFELGCFKVMLMSGATNRDAHRFYEGLGFQTTKTGFEIRAAGVPARKSGN
ncbi:GNAT family N-acetyltransferase [Labrenzia sp. VG12]|uniref:GNAT family N-acetyltransferase n=1 Tax=Labrenzia sp. VG12 TaxID=2021862 RepID=UPI0012FD7378|nr:GNAT family N-acetyltransferase [Labrenzia sp. VG12]